MMLDMPASDGVAKAPPRLLDVVETIHSDSGDKLVGLFDQNPLAPIC